MAPKPYSGATIELDGEIRTLRLTYGAIVEIRDATGIDILSGEGGEVDPYKVHLILAALLRHEDRDVDADDLAHMLDMGNMQPVFQAVYDAMSADMPQPQGAAKSAAPLDRGRKSKPRRS